MNLYVLFLPVKTFLESNDQIAQTFAKEAYGQQKRSFKWIYDFGEAK